MEMFKSHHLLGLLTAKFGISLTQNTAFLCLLRDEDFSKVVE